MRIAGLVLIVGGWLLAVGGLFITPSNIGRGLIACLGIAISLMGNLGVLNKYYLARAIWKK
ncbi:MAG: hypothetical protein HYZ73_06045 [Elusimicrobia bacterium]|nr:hypothetical protein [Elusimicrobiota bacterium]